MNGSRRGSQQPTLLHEPPDAADFTLGDIAVDWAREVAGIYPDEWQAELVRWTFARRSDGIWAARDVGAEVPRQNGKNIWLEIVELVSVFEFGDRLITHSAHRADVSHEHFVSMKEHIESADELMRLMPSRDNHGFVTTNGMESIQLSNGARILFKARAKSSGRGPRPQKVVFDEALVLEQSQVGAMAPGITAQRNPQLLFASSPPKADSAYLHALRGRALEPKPGDRLYYAAWNNPADTSIEDRDSWYRVNPSLGYGRMTEESLLANRFTMSAEEYMREHMGVPETPTDDVAVVPNWAELADVDSRIESHHCLALDVSPDRGFAAFGAAGRRFDGQLHVEAVECRPRTDWVFDVAVASWKLRHLPIRIQTGSPAGSFIAPLREAGVQVVEVSPADHAQAVGQFLDACQAEALHHPATPERPTGSALLASAVKNAELRRSGDVDLWARRSPKGNITPLVAVTLALGGVPTDSRSAYEDKGLEVFG